MYYIKIYSMKKLISVLFISLFTITSFSQKDYGFDIPWRAKSNEHILEWFIDKLDDECDTIVYELFDCAGTSLDSINWIYPSGLLSEITKKGKDYYSLRLYCSDTKTKEVTVKQVYTSENKLEKKTYVLFYTAPNSDGVMFFALSEYY